MEYMVYTRRDKRFTSQFSQLYIKEQKPFSVFAGSRDEAVKKAKSLVRHGIVVDDIYCIG